VIQLATVSRGLSHNTPAGTRIAPAKAVGKADNEQAAETLAGALPPAAPTGMEEASRSSQLGPRL